ncbi:FCGBP protein, partial [Bucorvus abyssinicus]|nr:FCGBP protein [Bucorvus abyssinicus]
LIDLPSSYYKSTCGLCGNFNLQPEDDVPKGGKDAAAVVAWAKGWKVPDGDDDDPFCWDYCEGDCPICEEEKKELYRGNHYSGCKAGERCAVVRGVRRCVATDRSICVATGDPHYTTFDGRRFDFMGTCVYQLAGLCSEDPSLIPFTVTVENNNRGSRAVSFTKEVTLNVYNMTLSLSQEHPQKLKVNGILVDLPFKHGNKLQAYLKGIHGFIRTDFDVIVTFDWYSYARVILPNTYSQAVCGLCGNANGDPKDDLVLPDGKLTTNETQFGDSWKMAEVPGCWAGCTKGCKVCSEAEKRAYQGDKHCGLIMKKRGPLAACHSVVDPEPYFRDCLFDVCIYEGHQDVVCSSISAYVSTCQSRGVRLKPWRTAAFCSPVCLPNQHYELCGPSCAATCRGQEEPEDCDDTALCAEGCFCDPGFLRSGRGCVPLSRCGCWHDGTYYETGQEFVPCPNCSQRCVCRGAGEVECRPGGCEANEVCDVRDGVRGCHPRSCGRCQVLGAGSVVTFDGGSLSFAGSCGFTLVAAKEDEEKEEEVGGGPKEPLVPFTVEVEKNGPVIRRLVVTVHGVTVGLERGTQWEVMVDGERHLLPLALAEGALTLSQEGTHRVLLAQGGFKLLFNGDTYVLVTLPSTYRGRTRGLCGNFDGNTDDDVSVGATLAPACTYDPLPPTCSDATEGPCQLLADPSGPFGGCHGVVAPQEHVTSCARQRCSRPDDADAVVCHSFQGYAAACQAAGGQLREWRAATNCPMSCPLNSRYELCTHGCTQSCADLAASTRCTQRCFEGCRCLNGFFFNGAECVPADQCGCLHRGRYFEVGADTVLSRDCSQSCTCRAAGGLWCRAAGCPFGQSCGLADGTRSCVDQPGRCTLAPASRFISFDGTTATSTIMTTGIYVVVTLCDTQRPAWFRLLADVGEDRDRPIVVALHLYSPGAFVTVRRDKKVWVNGVPATLPVKVSDMLTITETRETIWLTQDPQFVAGLSAAGEMTVTVTPGLSKTLCGFCGDYDGEAANDLRGPDGNLVATVVAAAKAWRSPDFLHVS